MVPGLSGFSRNDRLDPPTADRGSDRADRSLRPWPKHSLVWLRRPLLAETRFAASHYRALRLSSQKPALISRIRHNSGVRKPKATNTDNLRFTATLERANNNLGWVIARVPTKVTGKLGRRGQIRVRGEIGAPRSASPPFAFSTTLFPDGRGGHYLLVNRAMQKGGGVRLGNVAEISLRPDREKREIEMPREMLQALKEDRRLMRWFNASLTPSQRRDIARSISQLKTGAARMRRAEQLAERLMLTLEAERELPPLLRLMLARNYKAAEGWKLMTPTQRRFELLSIFYYRTPEGQQRRIEQAIEKMVERFEKQNDAE